MVTEVDALVERAREFARGERRTILGIAGPPGGGKSTLAQTVVAAVGSAAVLVPMDGFHLAQAELVRLGRRDRMGAPDTFDALGYIALLRRLRGPARAVRRPTSRRPRGPAEARAPMPRHRGSRSPKRRPRARTHRSRGPPRRARPPR